MAGSAFLWSAAYLLLGAISAAIVHFATVRAAALLPPEHADDRKYDDQEWSDREDGIIREGRRQPRCFVTDPFLPRFFQEAEA